MSAPQDFAQGYATAWRRDPPVSDDPDYVRGFDEGARDRKASDARGGPLNPALRNHRPGPRPMWTMALGADSQEPQEVIEAAS